MPLSFYGLDGQSTKYKVNFPRTLELNLSKVVAAFQNRSENGILKSMVCAFYALFLMVYMTSGCLFF